MIKKLLIMVIMMVALVTSVSAAGNLTVTTLTSTSATADVSSIVGGSFRITNSDTLNSLSVTLPSTVNFIGSSDNSTISMSYNVSSPITIANNSAVSVNYSFTVPAGAAETDTGVFNMTSSQVGSHDSFTFSLTTNQYSRITLPSSLDFGTFTSNSTETSTFRIRNTGTSTLTNLAVTSTAASKYNVTFSPSSVSSLAPGQNSTITVSAYLPLDESSEDDKVLGAVNVRSDQVNGTSFNLLADVQGKLRISDLDVKVGSDTDGNMDDGEKIEHPAAPGDTVKFEVKVKNEYSNNDDIDIENIVVTVTIEDIDDGDDMEEESSEFDLDPGDSETATLTFELPYDLEEGDYNVVIDVDAEDEDDNDLSLQWDLTLEVEKESHYVWIQKAELSPTTVACAGSASLRVEVMNLGKNDEDDVMITVNNPTLGVLVNDGPYELSEDYEDDDNEVTKTYNINIPSSTAKGSYQLEVRSYRDMDKLEDIKRVYLNYEGCAVEQETTEEETKTEETSSTEESTSEESEQETTPINESVPVIDTEVTEESFTESPYYVPLLVLLNIVIISSGFFLVYYYLIK